MHTPDILKTRREALLNLCSSVDSVANHLGLPLDPINQIRAELKGFEVRVAVTGEVNRGKSTFLNALLGTLVFPRRAGVCTAVLTELRDGPPSLETCWRNGGSEKRPLATKAVHKDLELLASAKKNPRAVDLARLRVTFPNAFARDGIVLVDTPGVNDPIDWREALTVEELRRSDAAIMLLDAKKPLTATESDFLVEHVRGPWSRQVIFVANKADALTTGEREAVRQRLEHELTKRLDYAPQIFLVSALQALKGRQNHDQQLVVDSGIGDLEACVMSVIVEKSVELFASARRKRLHHWAQEFAREAQHRKAALGRDVTTLRDELQVAERELDRRQATYRSELAKQRKKLKGLAKDTNPIATLAATAAKSVFGDPDRVAKCVNAYQSSENDGHESVRSLIADARGRAWRTATNELTKHLGRNLADARRRLGASAELDHNALVVGPRVGQLAGDTGEGMAVGLAVGTVLGLATGGISWVVMGAIGGGVLGNVAADAWRTATRGQIRNALDDELKRLSRALTAGLRAVAKHATDEELRVIEERARLKFQNDQASLNGRLRALSLQERGATHAEQNAEDFARGAEKVVMLCQ
jgi:GTP-binding protein EngB required for normal cell division